MPYDAGNRKDVKAAEKQAKLVEQQRREIVTGIMSVAPGRNWMCDILEHCHIFSTSFNDVPVRMAFMEGQREVGILLLTDIMASCPDHYILMMRERNERNSTYDARRSRPDTDGRNREPDSDNYPGGYDTPDFYDINGNPVFSESAWGEPSKPETST